jgi:hypothetical protein
MWGKGKGVSWYRAWVCPLSYSHFNGTPTKRQVSKRQVSKRQVSKRPVSKRLKRQVYKASGLQNVRLQKNIHKYSVLVVGGNPQVTICCSHVCRQSDGCVLFSFFKVFLSYITIMPSKK